ncbi:MAG: UvrD-helicase domain-containing protein, partial [Sphingomonadales bacterium]|nr:UvrD-helicase domain-containing protein [Sphingomonadales bacterium]
MSGEIHPLKDNQLLAVNPQDSVWLSASAGTGKTQVLSARVLRLLLQPRTSPSEILCLTFTKAGAAEMATRVNEVLARWVRMDDASLAIDLKAIGARVDEPTLARARTLFASVLDCPGGGLRIDTIHAFAQWLLAAFPEEAGLQPGARAMEDRDRDLLAHEVLAAMLVEAEQRGDTAFLDRLAALSLAMGADGARRWLMRCAAAREAWAGPNGWQPPMDGRVRQLLGMPADAGEEWLATFCTAPAFDDAALHACLAGYQGWKGKTADHACAIIPMWLALDAAGRLAQVDVLADALFFKNGNARLPKDPDPAFEGASAAVGLCLRAVTQARRLLELA